MRAPVRWATRYRLREYLATNLWVLPMVFTIGGYLFAVLVVYVDRRFDLRAPDYELSSAIAVLTAMFAGVVTFIGFVITIVLLVPQFASAQLSPRILAIWFRHSPIKLALSFFFFTAAYVFAVLGRVHGSYQPEFSITLAVALVFAGFLFFLWFMSQFSTGLRPATMSAIVARVGRDVILRTYPQRHAPEDQPGKPETEVPDGATPLFALHNRGTGRYLLGVDKRGLLALAERLDGVVALRYAVGEYVRIDAPLIEVYAAHAPRERELRTLVVLGAERTLEQDPAYVLRILVDVAVKGLSAAINDPTTAVQALDRVSDILHLLVDRDLGDGTLRGQDGCVRVVYPNWAWEDYLQLGTREIDYFGRGTVQVARRLRAILLGLAAEAPPDRCAAIEAELALLDREVVRGFRDIQERAAAREADYQGLGIGHTADLEPPGGESPRGEREPGP